MDKDLEQTEYQQATVLMYRNSYKSDDANADTGSSKAKPQRRLPTKNKGPRLITQLEFFFSRVLYILFTVSAAFFALLLLCFFGFNIFRSASNLACRFPNTSYLPTCQPQSDGNEVFDVLLDLQMQLVFVQETIAGGITLPMLLQDSKNVIYDVIIIIQKSKIPSRFKINKHLTHFMQLTDTTSHDIGSLLNKVDQFMDIVINLNELTVDNLKQIDSSFVEPPSMTPLIVAVLFNAPITIVDAVHRQYIQYLNSLMSYLNTLTIIAQLVQADLKQMADIQWNLRDLIIHEHKESTHDTYDVWGTFWTWSGRDKGLLKNLKQNAADFRRLDAQHLRAVDLINNVTRTLEAITSQLENLKLRAKQSAFNIASDLHLYVAFMDNGIDILKAERAKTRKAKQETMADIEEIINVQKRG